MSVFLQKFADTHSLQCLYTGITPGINLPEFTAVGLVDGEQVVYYDSNTRKTILKTEWLKKVNAHYPYYWNRQTQQMLSHQEDLKTLLATVILLYNRTKEVHTLQWMYGCELDDDGTIRVYMQYGYDGEDFVALDLRTETWIAARYHRVISTANWVSTAGHATYWKSYLEHDCIDQLQLFLSFGKETLERKVRPEGSVFQKHLSPSPEVVCHTTGFFPKPINITWQKDGEDVHEDVELRETLPNQDGSFQKRSILKVPAEELQNYTCVVQHSSLKKELVLSILEQKGLRNTFL
ncbi:H-2 class I histocompatibility antigen, Q10 alpha chain-like [Clarias gariepinus]|uniref:H-2 class I histocompatibility antigen, Q10 alpha chain-like n=1 Tax=Clarias gariepinus TaxID=13013 RepID=UPI00234D9FC2|nr:H-2 class I histocompatibility antigen, Q10 alpha chain-like [Clarias gariepinus]